MIKIKRTISLRNYTSGELIHIIRHGKNSIWRNWINQFTWTKWMFSLLTRQKSIRWNLSQFRSRHMLSNRKDLSICKMMRIQDMRNLHITRIPVLLVAMMMTSQELLWRLWKRNGLNLDLSSLKISLQIRLSLLIKVFSSGRVDSTNLSLVK